MHPNFFIVGAPKCGTTAWVNYLSSHPDICFSTLKEPHFFNKDFPNFRWIDSNEKYLELFKNCNEKKIVGEASVQYLYSEVAAHEIFKFAPKSKILIMLRKPAAFIRSYHNQLLMNCDETERDLRKAWQASSSRDAETAPSTCREIKFLDYKRVGMFSYQVERFYAYFPNTQIKVVFMDDWVKNPRSLYKELLEFLALSDDEKKDFPIIHSAKHATSRTLQQFTQRPPACILKLLAQLRKVPGLNNIKPSEFIRRINVHKGYGKKLDESFLDEVENYFFNDQVRLRTFLEDQE